MTNIGSATLSITGFSIVLPVLNTSAVSGTGWSGSAPLAVLYRRITPSACVAGLICTGSVRDNQFNYDGTYAANAGASIVGAGAPAGNLADPSWVAAVASAVVTGNGTVSVTVPSSVPILVAPGNVIGFWFRFLDGQSMSRATDSMLPILGTSTTNNQPGDPTFSYIEQGYLRMSAAMQATNTSVPNWVRRSACRASHSQTDLNATLHRETCDRLSAILHTLWTARHPTRRFRRLRPRCRHCRRRRRRR